MVKEGVRLTALKEFRARNNGEKAKKRARADKGSQPLRRCGRCSKARHNARTCKRDVEVVSK